MDLDEEWRDLIESSFTDPDITPAYIERELLRHAADHWEHCVNNFSHEECVNADSLLRIRASRRSTSFCNYNNNMKIDCSKVPMLATTDSDIIAGRAEVKYVPPAPLAPKPKPAAPAPNPTPPAPKPAPPVSKSSPSARKPEPPARKPNHAALVLDTASTAPQPAPPASKPASSKPKSVASTTKSTIPGTESITSAPPASKPEANAPKKPPAVVSKPPTYAAKSMRPTPKPTLHEKEPPSKAIPSVPKSAVSTSVPETEPEPKTSVKEKPTLSVTPAPKPVISSDDDIEPVSPSPLPVKTPIPGTVPASTPLPASNEEESDLNPNAEDSSSADKPADAPNIQPVLSGTEGIEACKPPHEGCVAVEHLAGYRKQHRADLVRSVLCGRGFCATPNHALIVDGKWTSMKELCAGGWQCFKTVRAVNNLDVFRNRRVQVGEVTITPYDIRFPRVGVWAVQMTERLFYDVIYDHCYGTLAVMVIISLHISQVLTVSTRI